MPFDTFAINTYNTRTSGCCLAGLSEEIFKIFINISKEVFKGSLHQYLKEFFKGKIPQVLLLSTNYSSGAISGSLTSASLELSTFSGLSSAAGRRTSSKASSEVLVISYSGFPKEFSLLVGSSSPEFSTSSPNISNYILHLRQETKVGVVLVLV